MYICVYVSVYVHTRMCVCVCMLRFSPSIMCVLEITQVVRSEASTYVNGVISLPLKLPEGDSLWYFATTTKS